MERIYSESLCKPFYQPDRKGLDHSPRVARPTCASFSAQVCQIMTGLQLGQGIFRPGSFFARHKAGDRSPFRPITRFKYW